MTGRHGFSGVWALALLVWTSGCETYDILPTAGCAPAIRILSFDEPSTLGFSAEDVAEAFGVRQGPVQWTQKLDVAVGSSEWEDYTAPPTQLAFEISEILYATEVVDDPDSSPGRCRPGEPRVRVEASFDISVDGQLAPENEDYGGDNALEAFALDEVYVGVSTHIAGTSPVMVALGAALLQEPEVEVYAAVLGVGGLVGDARAGVNIHYRLADGAEEVRKLQGQWAGE